ncbi:PAS domain S-box protein [Methanolobus sp. WCC4]|uniref:PAS domain S-box protein n=1 Tax=Methanolobus sp. WCC4 TaxID=3125784 RepID=UPI0030F698CB
MGVTEQHIPENDNSGFEKLVDELPLGILSCDREGNITAVNDFLLKILGSPSAGSTRMINMLTFPPLAGSGISATLEEALTTGKITSIKTPYTSKWGKELFLSFRAFPLKDENGEIYGCHVIIEDLTDKKAVDAEIEKNRLKDSLVSKISDRFINSSFSEIDEDINRTLEELADYTGVDRAALFYTDEGTDFLVKTHEWHADGVISTIPLNGKWDYKKLVLTEFNGMQIINIPDVDRMPEEREDAQKILQELEIKAIAMIPISHHGLFKGFISVDRKEEVHDWEEKDLHILKIAGNMMASILERRNAESLMLEKEQEYEDIIESLDTVIWKADFDDTGNAAQTYISKPMDKMLGFPEGTIGTDWECYFTHIHPDDMEKVQDKLKLAFENPKTPIDVEYRVLSDDGRTTWVNSQGSSSPTGNRTYRMVGTTSNITERKNTEEERNNAENKLRDNEEKLRILIEHAPVELLMLDNDLRHVAVSQRWNDYFGFDDIDTIGMKHYDVMSYLPDEIKAAHKRALKGEVIRNDGNSFELPDGTIRWTRWEVRPWKKADDTIGGIIIFSEDITERKEAEIALKESEERFKALHNASFGGITIHDKGKILECNLGLSEITGYSREELIGMDGLLLIAESHRDRVMTNILAGYEKPYEAMGRRKDGSEYPLRLEARNIPYKGKQVRVVEFRDITEQKKAEEDLRESEALLTEVGIIAKIGGWEFDASTGKGTWTQEVAKIHELDPLNSTDVEFGLSFYPPDSKELIEKAVHDAVQKGEPYDLELELITAKGTHKWIRTIGNPIIEDEKVVKVRGSFQDITERKNDENKLRESEEKLRMFIENAPASLAMVDRNMRYIAASRRWKTDYFLGDRDVTGLSHYEVFPEIPEEWKDMHRRALKGEVIPVAETRFERIDGRVQWVRGEVRPWRAADGTVGGMMFFSEDVTERKQAEDKMARSEAKYRSLFERSNDAIMIHDTNGKILEANERACEMFDYNEEELKQKSMMDLTVPEDREEIRSRMKELRKEGHCRRDNRMLCSDGTIVYADLSATFLEAEEQDLIQTVARDITDRVIAEEAMITAKIEAETANRTKSEFLANMSHELRTPLNSIIGFSDAMVDGMAGEIDNKQKHYLQNISDSGHHLLSLINDILDISKIEAGKMELNFDIVDISSAVNEVVTIMRPLAAEKNLTVDIDLPDDLPGIIADRSKIKQILYNLIGNAIKFTDNDGRITIHTETKGSYLQTSIIDTGIGISPIDQRKLFKPFSQIDSSISRRYAGTGLGLALVKDIVELHGGRIWVESKVSKGSNFTFRIPIND